MSMLGQEEQENSRICFRNLQFSSVAQSCPTLWDPMNRSMPGLPVHHQLPEFTQTHVLWKLCTFLLFNKSYSIVPMSVFLFIMQKLGWMKHKPESRFPGEISITSDMQMTPPLWQKVKRNWRASWWKWRREWKSWLNTTFKKQRSWHSVPLLHGK